MAASLAVLLAGRPVACADDEGGAVPREVEAAVDHGLAWLARTQQSDGTWGGIGTGGATAAATGLAVMAFMGRGHVPGQGPYGENINRGIDAIISIQESRRDGVIAERTQGQVMYDHGICTVALCEAYGMLDDNRQAKARTAIGKAIRVILNAQNIKKNFNDQGGWRYTPDMQSSDTSVTGWQLMALRGAKNVGAFLPQQAIDDGIAYIKRRAAFGGGFCYEGNNGPNAALTGTGILALSLMGQPDAPEVKAGGDFLLRTPVGNGGHYYYAVYYCSQAAWQLGGQYWSTLSREIFSDLLARQRGDGSWSGAEGGDTVCTGMAILALTVPYRYLPIYQR